MQHVAVLGLGVMGSGMAGSLLRAGYPVTVYNRTRERAAPLEQAGARVANSPREAAQAAEVVISMVADDHASQAIWLGPEGALEGARPGSVLIESSTLSSGWVAELAGRSSQRDCALLDAPVLGSKRQAEAGQLVFLVGGEPGILERVRPVLQAMSRQVEHMGPGGSGAAMKLVNNLLGGVQIAVLAEGLALAERAGLDVERVLAVLSNGAPGSPLVKFKAQAMASRNYSTNFALRWMHKDLGYALEEGVRQGLALSTVLAAREAYVRALNQGLGDVDFAAVIEPLRQQD